MANAFVSLYDFFVCAFVSLLQAEQCKQIYYSVFTYNIIGLKLGWLDGFFLCSIFILYRLCCFQRVNVLIVCAKKNKTTKNGNTTRTMSPIYDDETTKTTLTVKKYFNWHSASFVALVVYCFYCSCCFFYCDVAWTNVVGYAIHDKREKRTVSSKIHRVSF